MDFETGASTCIKGIVHPKNENLLKMCLPSGHPRLG